MGIVVKKFGGSSVGTPEKIKAVAARIVREKKPDDQVVVTVSAMGDTTDDLITLARQVTGATRSREMDMLLSTGEQISIALLAMALTDLGCPAVSLTGPQAGFRTNSVHMKARITAIKPDRVFEELSRGNVVVVAGFQGAAPNGDVTTLGRGGSDTTAVALAGALNANVCEIFTDVEGVYSADPRVVPTARKMKEITYNEMLELARLGAGVMQPRSVELGARYGVPIHVRSTFTNEAGTMIREGYTVEEKDFIVRGVTHDLNVAKAAIMGVPDKPGIAFKVFSALAEANIDVDMIVQSIRNTDKKINDIVFTVSKGDAEQTRTILDKVAADLGVLGVVVDEDVAKVSIVGAGMLGSPGMAARMFGALSGAGINIEVISTSEISLSCLIRAERAKDAVNAIHATFFRDSNPSA
jgi:aspartate kinase